MEVRIFVGGNKVVVYESRIESLCDNWESLKQVRVQCLIIIVIVVLVNKAVSRCNTETETRSRPRPLARKAIPTLCVCVCVCVCVISRLIVHLNQHISVAAYTSIAEVPSTTIIVVGDGRDDACIASQPQRTVYASAGPRIACSVASNSSCRSSRRPQHRNWRIREYRLY